MNDRTIIERAALLRGLLYAINPFLDLRDRMPLRCVQAFLAVALYPGESVSEYARRCDLNINTMSRNLLDIGERTRTGEPGLGLVQAQARGREQIYRLTAKGESLVVKVLRQIQPKIPA